LLNLIIEKILKKKAHTNRVKLEKLYRGINKIELMKT